MIAPCFICFKVFADSGLIFADNMKAPASIVPKSVAVMKEPMTFARRASMSRPDGFTRIELAFSVFAAALLLGVVVMPALAVAKSDSGRATCFNNLRLVGRAVQIWGSDHHHM